ncbi:MAG TPA: hypothetical protein VG937_23680 [Polyangiaceae bacterium]|nr:hypothetical protein [Polyangiaceae bacterium]
MRRSLEISAQKLASLRVVVDYQDAHSNLEAFVTKVLTPSRASTHGQEYPSNPEGLVVPSSGC